MGGIRDATPHAVENLHMTFDFLKTSVVPQYPQGVQEPIPCGYQNLPMFVSCVKWHRSVHPVGPLHLWTPHHRSKTVQVLSEKNARISGPMQFKTVLFKGRLFGIEPSSILRLFLFPYCNSS